MKSSTLSKEELTYINCLIDERMGTSATRRAFKSNFYLENPREVQMQKRSSESDGMIKGSRFRSPSKSNREKDSLREHWEESEKTIHRKW